MNDSAVSGVLGLAAATLAGLALVRQCRKPTWWPGRLFAHLMNASHRSLTNWGLGHVPFAKRSTVLDVGCGGGRTIEQLVLLAPEGKVHGIDYSAASVAVARQTNASSIDSNRVDIRLGSVSSLPFPPDVFDVVTAVETHYYWPNLVADLREILRVLRLGGRVAIIAESYRGKRHGTVDVLAMRLLGAKLLSVSEHRDVLAAAGFVEVEILEEREKGWICAVGTKRR